MRPWRSKKAASAQIDLTGSDEDGHAPGDKAGSSSPSDPWRPSPSPHRTQYESEDEDYINGILLAPADTDREEGYPGAPQRKKRRVLAHSDEDFEPGETPSTESQEAWWDRTGPSLHRRGRVSMQQNTAAEYWDNTGPSLHRDTGLAGRKRAAFTDEGIDWGDDRLAVVIDTPKEWFERQARARETLGVKPVELSRSVVRLRKPRRIVEVVIPVPRRSRGPRHPPTELRASSSEASLSNVLSNAREPKSTPSRPAPRRSPFEPPSDSESDEQPVLRRRTPVKKVLKKKRMLPAERGRNKKIKGKKAKRREDPDESSEWSSDDDGANQIELDEPERFKTATRLREVGPSAFQAKLKALGKLRGEREKGMQYNELPVELPTDSAESESGSGDDDDDDDSSGMSDFIVEHEGGKAVKLPEQFTVQKQPWQYKYKVAFQYLVLLVVKGEDVLPLNASDAAYFSRPLQEVRSLFKGIRNSIAGQVWPAKYRKALEKYPRFNFKELKKPRDFCTACNRHNQRCFKEAFLGGEPYRRETHARIDSEDSSYSTSEDEDYELGFLGNVCFTRTSFFHEIAHWEHKLFLKIRSRYHDLIRAKGKEDLISSDSDSLRSGSDDSDGGRAELKLARRRSEKRVEALQRTDDPPLPRDLRNADEITEWFDKTGFQKIQLHWLNGLETRGKNLERELLKG